MAMNLWGIIKGLLVQDETDRSKELSLEVDPTSTTGTRTTLKSAQTADRTIVLPDESGSLVTKATTDALDVRLTDAEADIVDLQGRMTTAEADIVTNASDITTETARAEGAEADEVARATAAEDAIASDLADHIANPTGAHAASAISNTPAGNVTSTDVQAAINELQSHIDVLAPGGGANTFLSNLTSPTAVNQILNPDTTNSRSLGQTGSQWLNVYGLRHQTTFAGTGEGDVAFGLITGLINDNVGASVPGMGMLAFGTTYPLYVTTANSTANNATPTGSIKIMTGPKTAGTGNSGSISLETGTSAGGTRGKVKMVDGSEGTIGHVWTQSDVDGSGSWTEIAAGKGVSRIVNIKGENTTIAPDIMNFSADQVILTDSSQNIVVLGPTGTISNDIDGPGASPNSRDQAAILPEDSWVHFYFIWNGSTLATLSSLSATAPTLPSGYTHKAYIGAVFKSTFLTLVTQRGSWIYRRNNSNNFAGNLTATVPTDVSLAYGIPDNALRYQFSFLGQLLSNASGTVDCRLIFYSLDSTQFEVVDSIFTGLGASQATTAQKGAMIMPNFNSNFRYSWQIAVGSSPSLAIRLHGYQVPNNSD